METSFPYNASVDERVNKLLKDGHKSPSGRVILSLTLTSPLSVDPTRELTLPAIYDSSSAFNIIGEADAEMLDMPLGSECTVKWDGTTPSPGRFGVAVVHRQGKSPQELIFCVLPNPYNRVLNEDSRKILNFSVFGEDSTNFNTDFTCQT